MTKATKGLVLGLVAGTLLLSTNLPINAATEVTSPAWCAPFEAGKLSAAKGEHDKAKEQLLTALKAAEKINDEQAIAEIANQLANVYLTQGDIINASAYAKRAKDVALKILMANPSTRGLAVQLAANEENGAIWIAHMMKAQFALDKKDVVAAQAEYQAAVNKAREYASDGMPMASALAGLGRVLVDQGKYEEAEPLLRQSIALSEKNWTPVTKTSALDAADAMDRLVVILEKTGRKDEAAKLTVRSKEVRETQSLKSTLVVPATK